MKTKTPAQLKKMLADHAKWFETRFDAKPKGRRFGADLYGANLRSANLRCANLRSANLRCADLYGANLRSANLYGANLYGANLRSANLRCANLYGADLRCADLYGADLGSKSDLGKSLRLIGACMEACAWVDAQPENAVSDFAKLYERCDRADWKQWLASALGGEPTTDRLVHVVDYVTKGH